MVFEGTVQQKGLVIPKQENNKQVEDKSFGIFDSFESAESVTDLFKDIASGQFWSSKSLLSDENMDTQVNTQPFYYMISVLLLFLILRIHFIKR